MVTHPHILIVDDDPEITDLVVQYLHGHGMRVSVARTGAEMAEVLARAAADAPVQLVLMDLRLQGESGLQLALRLREHSVLPVIFLTGQAEEADRVMGLELAADDYVVKPFSLRELLARIRAVLRRYAAAPPGMPAAPSGMHAGTAGGYAGSAAVQAVAAGRVAPPPSAAAVPVRGSSTHASAFAPAPAVRAYRFEGWELNLGLRRLRAADGREIELSQGEFGLLHALCRAPQQVLRREQLLDMTRLDATAVYDRAIDVQILRLRRKIEEDASAPRLIRTERGVGYCFDVQVEAVR
jgi:two-component system OmpR family response regulator